MKRATKTFCAERNIKNPVFVVNRSIRELWNDYDQQQ
jgi:hypothetical protein